MLEAYFVASHPVIADHFPAFHSYLRANNIESHIFARRQALDKLQKKSIEVIDFNELSEIFDRCARATIVITELCDQEMEILHKAIAERNPEVILIAYYDNSQEFVSHEYGAGAVKIAKAAGRLMFANANLKSFQVAPGEVYDLSGIQTYSIGFYSMEKVDEFIALRNRLAEERLAKKEIILFGAASNEYREAFPSLLASLKAVQEKMPEYQFIIQAHSRSAIEKETALPEGISLSHYTYENAIGMCTAALYFQTSDAPKIALADVPILHLSDAKNQSQQVVSDPLLLKNISPSATSSEELIASLNKLQPITEEQKKTIKAEVGYREDWQVNFMNAIQLSLIQAIERKVYLQSLRA